ncbi:phosphoglycerate kinase [Buchnera aphidicola (Nipponaphis monzeni)]|uniref:Phosphoglycerate kinase n=1 Tax=Buchnera aphidicola (Nipponaphis monzeni) TaxID=2495405 RepID=A0A455TAK3_9GAMM|nr:phosphoglycerate kinase [Buchnera aphidicola]BBI01345.1 phosphoglycerate kinase [Buchnera aphidicola (Nipponaphis monzeni)]
MSIVKIKELNLHNKKVLIRTDLNVPIYNKKITSDARILAALPTIQYAIQQKSKVIIMSHLNRPIEGEYSEKYSLLPVFKYLKKKLSYTSVHFCSNYVDSKKIEPGEVCLLENVRFNIGESINCDKLSKNYSKLCDIFVMDAFGSAHRKQSSTYGIMKFTPIVCAGLLLEREIKILSQIFINPMKPIVAIVGGSKISTKLKLLNSLGKIADTIIVGGGIANTFIAIDNNVGNSLYEKKFIPLAKKLKNKYNILIPIDSRVGHTFSSKSLANVKTVSNINNQEEIMDLGDETIKLAKNIINTAKTIIWNGPVGVFEFPNFRIGTKIIATSIANSRGFSVAGGGDTLSVIDMFSIKNKISYISTGGGSFLQFLEGKQLPVIKLLEQRSL